MSTEELKREARHFADLAGNQIQVAAAITAGLRETQARLMETAKASVSEVLHDAEKDLSTAESLLVEFIRLTNGASASLTQWSADL